MSTDPTYRGRAARTARVLGEILALPFLLAVVTACVAVDALRRRRSDPRRALV